ncbi:unnamed protein product [Diatraea saccharalis]|uniref:Uncharacterized protein n=1 Tax=Diatraea saccharalis TaxID=40085 RepID=A0A9N9WBA2_9NEOP|nr:unnamed protein product [Diatraea saccharalis]
MSNVLFGQLGMILPLVISATAIRVPVDNEEEDQSAQPSNHTSQSEPKPIYYESDGEDSIDSYLIPPNPHKDEEVLLDSIVTPATYLLPPSIEKQKDYYYAPTESTGQSDWQPIVQSEPNDQSVKLLPLRQQSAPIPIFMRNDTQSGQFEIYQRPRAGKMISIPIPSLKLEPPSEDAPDEFFINVPSKELELPAEEIDQQYIQPNKDYPDFKYRLNGEYPTVASHLTPPRLVYRKFKNPTKLYPKKYPGTFKPLAIPIAQYAEDLPLEAPKAKPIKYFKPSAGIEDPIAIPIDEKQIYLFDQAEQKRKFKEENEAEQEAPQAPANDYDVVPLEQDASETNFRYPGHNIYHPRPALLRQRPPAPAYLQQYQHQDQDHHPQQQQPQQQHQEQQQKKQEPPAPEDRTEFRMHGMKGPHSYQFGYDTGKGKNRQFRYEERDNDGLVQGHYGYMDKTGKLRVVNYRAHPEYGFQAEPQEEPQAEPKVEPKESEEH